MYLCFYQSLKNSAYLSVYIFASGIVVEWCCFPEGYECLPGNTKL